MPIVHSYSSYFVIFISQSNKFITQKIQSFMYLNILTLTINYRWPQMYFRTTYIILKKLVPLYLHTMQIASRHHTVHKVLTSCLCKLWYSWNWQWVKWRWQVAWLASSAHSKHIVSLLVDVRCTWGQFPLQHEKNVLIYWVILYAWRVFFIILTRTMRWIVYDYMRRIVYDWYKRM